MKRTIVMGLCLFALIFLIGMERGFESRAQNEPNEAQLENELKMQEARREKAQKEEAESRKKEEELKKEQQDAESRLEQAATKYGMDSKQYQLISNRMTQREGEISSEIAKQQSAQKEINDAKKQIDDLAGQLSSLRESPNYQEQKLASAFRTELEKNIQGKTRNEITETLNAAMSGIEKRTSYIEQKALLNELKDIAQTNADDQLVKQAELRIKEIDMFRPQNLATNAVERELNLDQKIPMDQAAAIDNKTLELTIAYQDAYRSDNKIEINRINQTMKELKDAIDRFKLKSRVLESSGVINLTLESIARVGLEMPQEFTALENKIETAVQSPQEINILGDLSEITADLAETPQGREIKQKISDFTSIVAQDLSEKGAAIASIAVQKAIDNYPGLRSWGKEKGASLIEYAQKIESISKIMQKVGSGLDFTVAHFAEINSVLDNAGSLVRIVPGRQARDIGDKIAAIKNQLIKRKPLLEKGQAWGPLIAQRGFELADLVRGFGETLSNLRTTEDLSKIAKAQALVEIERTKLLASSPKSRFEQFFTPVTNFFKRISDSVKNLFRAKQSTLERATGAYNNARKDYLNVLGFTNQEINSNLSPSDIQNKLTNALQDQSKLQLLNDVQNRLIRTTNDLMAIYRDITDQLRGNLANIDYLVTGWDAIEVNKQITFAEFVPTIIEAHDQRMAYLDAAMKGVKILQDDLNELNGTAMEAIASTFANKVSALVSGEIVATIGEYAQIVQGLDKSLAYQKQELEAAIEQGGGPL